MLFSCIISSVYAAIPTHERNALIALYNSTNGDNWKDNRGWLGGVGTECFWYRVTCNESETSITRLVLINNNLLGSIPAELGQLSSLTRLVLVNNQLTGSIPAELGKLSSLTELTLTSSQLTGSIPAELGQLSSLTRLVLSSNQLTGSIPAELGQLDLLEYLFLSNNQLSGSIPDELSELSSYKVRLDPANEYFVSDEFYTVNILADAGGSISPNTELSIDAGQTQLFEITANTGYAISSVSGCSGSLTGNTYTTAAINANCTVIATFTENTVNGVCGSSHGQTLTNQPQTNLCATGSSSAVIGSNPWIWSCNGSNSGSNASCSTIEPIAESINGTCGSSHGQTLTAQPTTNLCATGSSSAAVVGANPWIWICNGLNGGSAVTCATVEPEVIVDDSVNGVCGSNNGVTLTTQPTTNLCTSGTSSALVGANPWLWSCNGVNGGSTVTCATVGSDPVITGDDSDGDGLSNEQEAELGTNPNNADSDADGMPDGWEVENGLNPTLDDAGLDADKDGLDNLAEYHADTTAYTWSGNGSIISDTGLTRLGDEVNRYGVTKDSVQIHADTEYPPVGFFQWQINTNQCSSLIFDVNDESMRDNNLVNITYGGWDDRSNDKVFKQVSLPFTVSAANMGENHISGHWRVFAVAFNQVQDSSSTLNAQCSNDTASNATAVAADAITLDDGSVWSGTGSIVRREFGDIGASSLYGVNRDESKVHAGDKNSVFFQWQPSVECTQLVVSAGNQSSLAVNWGMKAWNADSHEMTANTLPLVLDHGNNSWNLIRLDFADVTESTSIKANCL